MFRLRRAGASGCWMGRQRAFKEAKEFGEKPATTEYTHVCKPCWPGSAEADAASGSEGSSAGTEDGGTPQADRLKQELEVHQADHRRDLIIRT